MAEAVVRYVLHKITEAAYQEALFLYGAGDKVEWAKRELEWVSAFLNDADTKQIKDARVKRWVKDVKEVAYMIEDALDKFFVEMGGGRSKGVLRRVSHIPKVLVARHKVGNEINKIKERMREIKDNVTTFGLMSLGISSGGSNRQPLRPVVVPDIDKTEVIGFKDDINKITEQLIDKDVLRRSVISIVGPGGRGKTTVATKVYKSAGVGRHFDCRIWVTVSQEFKIIEVLKKMLLKLQGENAREVIGDEEYFITEVHKSLSKKKYLIVLDDVWSSDLWTQLEVALPEDHNGSRLLITTRFINIAKESNAANKPYELRILSRDESQQLLLQKVFPNQPMDKCPNDLLALINQFAEKCGGWPLALVVMGGILSTKDPDYNTWNDIMLKMDWQIEGSRCLDILSTSYEDLPSRLKPCFMHIASFPEDYKINASTLIQMWIAEGFIHEDYESKKSVEDTAENCLEELVQRCMVQVSKRSWSGRIKYCYIHDMLRELAIGKAKDDKFLLVCSKSNANSIFRISAGTRRIAFHEYNNTKLLMESVGPNLRSLTYFGGHLPYCGELSMIRVLHMEYDWDLQYYKDDAKWLNQATILRYFQSNGTFKKSKMPTSFWNNKMLRYVKLEGNIFTMGPPSSVNLENLVTLKVVIARAEWTVKLPHFPRIRKLGIFVRPDTAWAELANLMSNLEHLESLYVIIEFSEPLSHPCLTPAFKNYKQMHSLFLDCNFLGGVVGDSSLFPPHLVKLTLRNCRLMQDPMPELEKLPSLRVLRLLDLSYKGEQLICSARGFTCLQQLKLAGLENLVELKIEEGAMPVLNLLEICRSFRLQIFPDLQYLTYLRELKLWALPDEFCSSLKGANLHKVKHIPSIIIDETWSRVLLTKRGEILILAP